jgi:branched-chain amino acid transport system permease protein
MWTSAIISSRLRSPGPSAVFAPDWIGSLKDALHLPASVRDQLPLALFGAVFVVAMLAFPHGIQGGLFRFWMWRARLRRTTARADSS